jgi:hypothetical protein
VALDELAHFGRCGSSSAAKNADAAFEDLVGTAQLAHLTAEATQLLALLAGQQLFAFAGVRLSLYSLAQRLVVDAEIARHMGDRPAGLQDEPSASVKQLLGVLLLSAMA